jgi:hypothetical protein
MSSAKIPVINDGVVSALDANMPSQGPPESWLLICSHQTSAVEAPNMAGMAKWVHQPCRETYTKYMCHRCCHWCSALVVRPSQPANIRHDYSSTRHDINNGIININNDIRF